MKELLAHVGAELKRPKKEISEEIVFLINSRIKPPKPVSKEDIFVRTMFLVSDEVNSYGGRFPLEELHKIADLVIDSPVMVGHTKEKLPIARNFKAEVVQKDGKNWVKVWFYWLKNSTEALSLKENIDHGIYKECSLGFMFEFPQCSICGEDMRRCNHLPLKSYQTKEGEREAFFYYRNITRVLETSLVYRGAAPNTSMSDELWLYPQNDSKRRCGNDDLSLDSRSDGVHRASPLEFVTPTKPDISGPSPNEFFYLEELSSLSESYLIEPKYDGIRAQIHRKEREVRIFTGEGDRIEDRFPRLVNEILSNPQESFILDGELVKYKGNSRLLRKDVASYICQKPDGSPAKGNDTSDDSHFRFKLFDLLYLNGEDKTPLPLEERKGLLEEFFPDADSIQKVNYEMVSSTALPSKVKSIATSEGAMIKKVGSGYFDNQSWYKWNRHLELDVLVTGVERNKGGSFNYHCALESRENPLRIGITYSTYIQARQGDIIRVRIDYAKKTGDGFTWHAPRVLDIRSDKRGPDPVAVLERIIGQTKSTDKRQPSAGENLKETGDRQRTADRFVLQLHWWGKARHHDLRFQKDNSAFGLTIFELDLDELKRGRRFLCEWKDEHDLKWMDFEGDIPPEEGGTEGNPSKVLVAYMRILDKEKYQILERKEDFSSFKIEGKILNGIYLARKVRLKGNDRWLFWKRSTDETD